MAALKHFTKKPFEHVNWAKYRESFELLIDQINPHTGKMQHKICLGYDHEKPTLDLGKFEDRHLVREIQRVVRTNPHIIMRDEEFKDPIDGLVYTVLFLAYDIKEGEITVKPTDVDFKRKLLRHAKEVAGGISEMEDFFEVVSNNKTLKSLFRSLIPEEEVDTPLKKN